MSTSPSPSPSPSSPALSGRSFALLNAGVSIAVLGGLAWLLMLRQSPAPSSLNLRFVPALNASFNTLASVLLIAGWRAIRRGDSRRHRAFMVGAFGASALFLVGYVGYHFVHGDTRFVGPGVLKVIYLLILATHVLLSMALVPLVLTTFFLALSGRFVWHRKVARFTLPVWLYVSVTGVAIFVLLHGLGFNAGT